MPTPHLTSAAANPTKLTQRGPDFVGIGAQKSATTFVYEMLRRHPQLEFPATPERYAAPREGLEPRQLTWPKEMHFLKGRNENLSWEDYLDVFDEKEPGKLYGEITPFYLLAPVERIQEFRHHTPAVRLFAILRDPVERDWSSIRMVAAQRGLLDDPKGLRRLARSKTIRIRGDYVSSLRKWLSVFPLEQLLVLPYELLKRDRAEFLAALCAHLGVPAEPLADHPDAAVFEGPKAELPDDIRAQLTDRHRGVVAALRDLCGVDFSRFWSAQLG